MCRHEKSERPGRGTADSADVDAFANTSAAHSAARTWGLSSRGDEANKTLKPNNTPARKPPDDLQRTY